MCAVKAAVLAIELAVTAAFIFLSSWRGISKLVIFVIVVVVVVFLPLFLVDAFALHSRMSLAFVPRVGTYPSRLNFFLQVDGSNHSRRPTTSWSVNLDAGDPSGKTGRQLLIFVIAAAVLRVDRLYSFFMPQTIQSFWISSA
jgi:hypothetical protein